MVVRHHHGDVVARLPAPVVDTAAREPPSPGADCRGSIELRCQAGTFNGIGCRLRPARGTQKGHRGWKGSLRRLPPSVPRRKTTLWPSPPCPPSTGRSFEAQTPWSVSTARSADDRTRWGSSPTTRRFFAWPRHLLSGKTRRVGGPAPPVRKTRWHWCLAAWRANLPKRRRHCPLRSPDDRSRLARRVHFGRLAYGSASFGTQRHSTVRSPSMQLHTTNVPESHHAPGLNSVR